MLLRFILTNRYIIGFSDVEIIRLCQICAEVGVGFVKTSTGYGFDQLSGDCSYQGAKIRRLELMREHVGQKVAMATEGVRTLNDLLMVRALGFSRVGTVATEVILEEAVRLGIGSESVDVEVVWDGASLIQSY